MKKLLDYRLSLVMILIGAGLIAIIWKVSISWIAVPVFIIGALFIILGLTFAGNIAEAQTLEAYPDYKEPLKDQTIPERILHYAGYAAAVSAYIAITTVGRYIDNTISGTSFFFYCAAIGLLLGFVYYRVLKIVYPRFLKNNEKRSGSILAACFAIIIWSAFGFAFYNVKSINEIKEKKVFVEKKSKNISKGTFYVFLNIDGKRERFNPKKSDWDKACEGDSLIIVYGRGKMGYDYILKFKTPDKNTVHQ